jgi:inward rectifier potassium channel
MDRFGEVFFYSVHIITTIGESGFIAGSLPAKIIVSLEAMTGLLGFAIAAGVIFARFSNPSTNIRWSRQAVIAPYKDITGFMTRLVNNRSNELIDVKAVVTLAMETQDGKRRLEQLSLERENILVFPLSWTIVHPITKESPLYGLTIEDLERRKAEFLIAISAVDQELSRTVYVRHSYIPKEIMSGVKFANILENAKDGTIFMDPARIDEIENVA